MGRMMIKTDVKDEFEIVRYLTTKKDGHEGIKTMQIMGTTGAMMQMAFCGDVYSNSYEDNKDNPDIPFTALLGPDPVHIPDRRGALLVITLLRDIWNLGQIKLDQ